MDNNLPVKPSDKVEIYIPSKLLPNLTPDELSALKAGVGLPIKQVAPKQLDLRIERIVYDAYTRRGQRVSDDKGVKDLQYKETCAHFAIECETIFPNFTLEQISEAVRLGALGKFEEPDDKNKIVHISVYGLVKWVWAWNHQVKQEAIAKHNKALDEEEKKVSEEKRQEGIAQFRNDIEQAFTDWKEMEALAPDKEYYYSAMYEYIEKQFGALRKDIKENLWNQAVEEVKSEALSDEDLRLKRFYKADFEEKKHTQTKMRAKTLALIYVFTWLRDQGEELVFN